MSSGAGISSAAREWADTSAAARTLRVPESLWLNIIDDWRKRVDLLAPEELRLSRLAALWRERSLHESSVPDMRQGICPVCSGTGSGVVTHVSGFAYARCRSCGHGFLITRPATDVYTDGSYYTERRADGAGYDGYLAQKDYREARARSLLSWIFAQRPHPPETLLEVGSGFGFTRAAARGMGCSTTGVDVNGAAAQAARELYGFVTITSTLPAALDGGSVPEAASDLVLYQFVLEHIPDLHNELRAAARCLTPRGMLGLLVPSFEATELTVFGASYRSLRADHAHLFSWRSLDLSLRAAGLRRFASKTECSVHLLLGFLTQPELNQLYRLGKGPDMVVLAERIPDELSA